LLWEQLGGIVAGGPFRGLRYIRESVGSAWAPKMLGTYEKELWPVIDVLIGRRPRWIIDVGAAEGYYAVGLAMRLGAAQVVAFEADEDSHPILLKLAELNGVADRITVRGCCTSQTLDSVLDEIPSPAIICDVEGAEYELMDPVRIPALTRSDILVELHEFHRPDMADVLRRRFSGTHDIELIPSRPRSRKDLPPPVDLTEASGAACLDEQRPGPMNWFWMTAKAATAGHTGTRHRT